MKIEVELENYDDRAVANRGLLPEERVRSQRVDVVVDSGAVTLVLPQDLVESLGLRTLHKAVVTCADERTEERNSAGIVSVRVAGRNVETKCVVGPSGSDPLLGQIVLEEADLLIDWANQRLISRPESPSLPPLNLKGEKSRFMSQTASERVCTACGKPLTRRECRKDSEGKYFCRPCYNQSPRQCACCDGKTTRGNCHRNRYGEYICKACYASGKRASRGRLLRKRPKWLSHWALYVPVAIVGLCIVYWVFSKIVDGFSLPPDG